MSTGIEGLDTEGYPGEMLSYKVTFQNTGSSTMFIRVFLSAEITPSEFTLAPGDQQVVDINYEIPFGTTPGRLFVEPILFDESGTRLNYTLILPGTVLTPKMAITMTKNTATKNPAAVKPC